MTELDTMLGSVNPVPEVGPGSAVPVPPFDAVWAAVQDAGKPRRRRFVVASVGALAVGILAAALVLGTAGNGPTSAFAAWSATPTKPVRGEIVGAAQRCHQATPTLADTRGPFELLLFKQGARQLVECHAWPHRRVSVSDPQFMGRAPAPNSVTIIGCNSGGYSTASQARTQAYLQMYGQVGTGVGEVTLRLHGGRTIQATTSKGLWAAWWPGSDRDVSVRAISATATTITRPTADANC